LPALKAYSRNTLKSQTYYENDGNWILLAEDRDFWKKEVVEKVKRLDTQEATSTRTPTAAAAAATARDTEDTEEAEETRKETETIKEGTHGRVLSPLSHIKTCHLCALQPALGLRPT